jgi:hypothetical protein
VALAKKLFLELEQVSEVDIGKLAITEHGQHPQTQR